MKEESDRIRQVGFKGPFGVLKKVCGGNRDANEKALLSSKCHMMVAWTRVVAVGMKAVQR